MKIIASRRDATRIAISAGITIVGLLTMYGITRSEQINPSPDANIGGGMIYLFGMGIAIIGSIVLLASLLHLLLRSLTGKLQLSRILALVLTAATALVVYYIFIGTQISENAVYQKDIASRYGLFVEYQEPVKLDHVSGRQSTSVTATDSTELPSSIKLDLHTCEPGAAKVRDVTGTTHFAFSGVMQSKDRSTLNYCIFYMGREDAGQPWDQTLDVRCRWILSSSPKYQYGDELTLKVDDTGIQLSKILGFCQDTRTGKAPVGIGSAGNTDQSKVEAIRQAEKYRPEGMCPQAITPAIHEATGAEYTFNNGCLPPGWQAAPREPVSN